jgi:hypothetical protein
VSVAARLARELLRVGVVPVLAVDRQAEPPVAGGTVVGSTKQDESSSPVRSLVDFSPTAVRVQSLACTSSKSLGSRALELVTTTCTLATVERVRDVHDSPGAPARS